VTAPEWVPERTITPALAADVIAAQFPELADLPVRPFDAGWDNVVLAVGDEWIFRFVHRAIALDGAVRERAVLLALDELPLPIPRPRFLGRPTPQVGWPFWGARLLPGQELAVTGLPDDEREPCARALGTFLRALHAPEVATRVVHRIAEDGVTLPVDPLRRGDPAHIAGRARGRLEQAVADGVWTWDPRVGRLLDEAATAPTPSGQPVLVHGDLHVRHVLVTRSPDGAAASGVIDWGDVALADPAVDLAIAYTAFDGAARAALLSAYGGIDPDRELAARTLAVHLSVILAGYAAVEQRQPLLAEALAGLRRAVT
jgi:aminoglycoside phosphotransferase (APT) family kinase protein